MLRVTNHQGNVSQNHNELSLHTYQDDYYEKKKKKPRATKVNDVEKLKPLHTFAQNNANTMKNIIEAPQKVKNRNTI